MLKGTYILTKWIKGSQWLNYRFIKRIKGSYGLRRCLRGWSYDFVFSEYAQPFTVDMEIMSGVHLFAFPKVAEIHERPFFAATACVFSANVFYANLYYNDG